MLCHRHDMFPATELGSEDEYLRFLESFVSLFRKAGTGNAIRSP